jgi:hypothetical protein
VEGSDDLIGWKQAGHNKTKRKEEETEEAFEGDYMD